MLKQIRFNMLWVLMKYLASTCVYATTLTNFDVVNYYDKSIIILDFQGAPIYTFHFLDSPKRLILDISYVVSPSYFKKVPVNFFSGNLINQVRVDKLVDRRGMRFIFDLVFLSNVDDIFLERRGLNTLLFVVTKKIPVSTSSVSIGKRKKNILDFQIPLSVFKRDKNPFVSYMDQQPSKCISTYQMKMFGPIIVAIDAGHGGHDPGARGYSGIYEKNITIAIAKKFEKLLDKDPIFSPVMIRDGDYFVSVLDRAELARNKGAKVLLSIHADATSKKSKSNVRGSSVWVLSDRGANIEMSQWLSNSLKWSQLPAEVNNILASATVDSSEQYFRRTILDLQFCHSQKVGYRIASHILQELKNVAAVHKYVPEYSNFAILRALDIPSVLIETGFITHAVEEKLLANDDYQEKIACALYRGLRSYFLGNSLIL